MATLLDFRRRIRSVKNTQQITRAMKFVAAARLRRAQEKAFSSRPYARALARVIHSAALRVPGEAAPPPAETPEERRPLPVNRREPRLVRAFNANVIRKAIEFLRNR